MMPQDPVEPSAISNVVLMNGNDPATEHAMRKPQSHDTIGQGEKTARSAPSGSDQTDMTKTVGDKARAAAEKAGKLASEAKSAAREAIAETASEAGSRIHETARSVHDEAVEQVTDMVDESAEYGKGRGRGFAMSFSRAFHAAGDSLEQDGHPGFAGYASAAGQGLSNAADEIDQLQTSRVTGQIETFMRERPLATAGLFALAGFVIVGALKATRPGHAESDDDVDIG